MKKFGLTIAISCLLYLLITTLFYTPNEIKLSGGYKYYSNRKDIIHKNNNIPPTVLDYKYNQDFIIALQKPEAYDKIIYGNLGKYEYGRDTIYYWLIICQKDSVIGPMSFNQYIQTREIYKVPSNLQLMKYH